MAATGSELYEDKGCRMWLKYNGGKQQPPLASEDHMIVGLCIRVTAEIPLETYDLPQAVKLDMLFSRCGRDISSPSSDSLRMSAAPNSTSASGTPNFPTSSPAHSNKLTQCFDDIMKVAAEMMVQQQLKTVQLDTSVINGFSEAQQRVLSEKVHMFHSILDDLETTLSKSKSYVGAIYEIGVQKEKQREQERIDQRRRQEEEEEEQRKNRELEELKSRTEPEQRVGGSRQQHAEPENGFDFAMDRSNGMLPNLDDGRRNLNGSPAMVMSARSQSIMTPGESQQQSPRNSQGQPTRGEDMGEMGNLDISMFPGLDNTGFDMGNFNGGINESDKNGDKNTDTMASFDKPSVATDNAAQENPSGGYMADSGENYLTLNDFNDLNIDWAANGDSGDLDLNGFNI